MAKMGRPRLADDSVHVGFRVSASWLDRAEALREHLQRDGYVSDRAAVLRAALGLGLDALERKHGVKRGRR
jgi:hypothetical protein